MIYHSKGGIAVGGYRVFPVHKSANQYGIVVKFLRTEKSTFYTIYGKLRSFSSGL